MSNESRNRSGAAAPRPGNAPSNLSPVDEKPYPSQWPPLAPEVVEELKREMAMPIRREWGGADPEFNRRVICKLTRNYSSYDGKNPMKLPFEGSINGSHIRIRCGEWHAIPANFVEHIRSVANCLVSEMIDLQQPVGEFFIHNDTRNLPEYNLEVWEAHRAGFPAQNPEPEAIFPEPAEIKAKRAAGQLTRE